MGVTSIHEFSTTRNANYRGANERRGKCFSDENQHHRRRDAVACLLNVHRWIRCREQFSVRVRRRCVGLAIDATDDAYIVGGTTSTDFPVNGHRRSAGSAACGANTNGSAFITVINTTAQTLTYSHCLSGNPGEEAGVRSQPGNRCSGSANQSCVHNRDDYVSELPDHCQLDSSMRDR